MPKAQERREGGKEAEMQQEGREGKGRLRREAGKMLFLGTSEAQIFTNTTHLVMTASMLGSKRATSKNV